jgi:GDP-L-fucose synthase
MARTGPFELKGKRVYVAGHRGMVGAALVRRLLREDCEILVSGRNDVDLRNQAQVEAWFAEHRPQAVFVAAAKVGGIHANNVFRGEFIYDNLAIALNLVHAARGQDVEKLMFLGSTCVYPKFARQPMAEDQLLTGALEPTNEPYAIAKIAGIKLVESYRRQYGCDYVSVMPTNLYGPGDNYHPENAHVAAALIRRFHEARSGGLPEVVVWGTGTPRREFLHVDDLADACVHLMRVYSEDGVINIGVGEDIAISDLAAAIAEVVGFSGRIVFDPSRPDGTPRKLVDVTKLKETGWAATMPLAQGLAAAYADFLTTAR